MGAIYNEQWEWRSGRTATSGISYSGVRVGSSDCRNPTSLAKTSKPCGKHKYRSCDLARRDHQIRPLVYLGRQQPTNIRSLYFGERLRSFSQASCRGHGTRSCATLAFPPAGNRARMAVHHRRAITDDTRTSARSTRLLPNGRLNSVISLNAGEVGARGDTKIELVHNTRQKDERDA